MKSIDIANTFISRYGSALSLTNLKLNKLVYFAQVESVRACGAPLFDDAIEAWQYGPVARAVYDEFKHCGRAIIEEPSGPVAGDPFAIRMVDEVAASYGKMSAFDLVELSHRDGGAWRKVYVPAGDNPITVEDIRASRDMDGFPGLAGTVRGTIAAVADSIPNALNLLRNS